MLYECECGCGEKVEKTISFSDACRKRIVRNRDRSTKKSPIVVLKTDTSVLKLDTPPKNPVRISDEIRIVGDLCVDCEKEPKMINPFTGEKLPFCKTCQANNA